ncbi:MAG: LapA family protein [Acidimicrobiia bacterium]
MVDEQHAKSRIKPHHVVVAICALVLLVFALANIDDVRVDFVFETVRAPLVLVIVVCALLGFVIGWVVGRRRNDD